jgi:hypothetical protein
MYSFYVLMHITYIITKFIMNVIINAQYTTTKSLILDIFNKQKNVHVFNRVRFRIHEGKTTLKLWTCQKP